MLLGVIEHFLPFLKGSSYTWQVSRRWRRTSDWLAGSGCSPSSHCWNCEGVWVLHFLFFPVIFNIAKPHVVVREIWMIYAYYLQIFSISNLLLDNETFVMWKYLENYSLVYVPRSRSVPLKILQVWNILYINACRI